MKNLISIFVIILLFPISITIASVEYDAIKVQVGSRVITKNEIELRAFELAKVKLAGKIPSPEMINVAKDAAMKQLVEETLLDLRAAKLNIFVSENELDDEIERFQEQRKISQIEFEELLERQNLSLIDFRKSYRRQILRNRLIAREVRSKIDIDEAKIQENYENSSNSEKLVHARHILLLAGSDTPKEKVEQVKNQAVEIRQRLLSGQSFTELALLYSQDPSVKANKGDLGFFKRTDMVKEFADAAFVLNPGEVSQPVRSPFGFHLIEVLELKTEPRESFEKVKNKLIQQEYQNRFQEELKTYMSELKKNTNIVYR